MWKTQGDKKVCNQLDVPCESMDKVEPALTKQGLKTHRGSCADKGYGEKEGAAKEIKVAHVPVSMTTYKESTEAKAAQKEEKTEEKKEEGKAEPEPEEKKEEKEE